ncbi:MAG: tetratricopeptide repeat protein [Deltaproteobacteria bacterium]|nr:tetratricopeptide repeat protein [Deltaproteobacteria bacterium]
MRLVTGVLLFGLSTSSCVVTQEEGDALRADIERLKSEIADQRARQNDAKEDAKGRQKKTKALEQRIGELEETLRTLRQADADNGVQMEKVIAELQVLRGDIQTLQHALGQTQEELEGTKVSVKEIIDRPPPTLHTAAEAPTVEEEYPKATKIGGVEVAKRAQAHYNQAKIFLDEKKYSEAIESFRLFIQRHADKEELVDNAWFWKGESHYSSAVSQDQQKAKSKSFKKAILSYQKVLDVKGSNKADGALYKIGMSFEQLGFKSEAGVFFQEVIDKHPTSPLVKDAKKRKNALKSKRKKKKRKKKKRKKKKRKSRRKR